MSSLTMTVIIGSGAGGTLDSLAALIMYFFNVLVSVVFLTLAFSFLASFGYFKNERKFVLIISVIGGLIFFLFIGLTLASLLVAAGVFLSSYLIVPLANNYGKEMKNWIHFRVGSNSTSRAHFVFNIFVALAVFAAILINQPYYEEAFRSDLKQTMMALVGGSLPAGVDSSAMTPMIEERINEFLNSPLISSYTRWLPAIAAFGVWALLEIMRLFLPFLAGLFTALMIKIEKL